MDNKTFEIRDEEINVNEIIDKIRENIQKRTDADVYPPDPNLNIALPLNDILNADQSNDTLQQDLSFVNTNWDIHNNSYFIKSHRPYLGLFLVKGRKVVHGEVSRYVDPIISRQSKLNEYFVKLQNSTLKRLDAAEVENVRQARFLEMINDEINDLQKQLERLDAAEVENATQARLLGMMNDEINDLQKQLKALQSILLEKQEESFNYSKFIEEIGKGWTQISGHSTNEPNFFEDSLQIFKNCNNIIDIGCGKGYFLELLKNHTIGSYGIDINSDFIQYCQDRGLTVHNVDAIKHLKSLEDCTLDGIFMCQLIEHLDSASLYLLLKLGYQKIKPGCSVIISIPNISSVQVSSNLFYLDPSHKTHIHPEVLKFLLKSSGFNVIQEKYYQPVPDDFKLRKIDQNSIQNVNQELINVFNYNIECLNNSLFGARDYAVIAKK